MILEEIIRHKRLEIDNQKKRVPLDQLLQLLTEENDPRPNFKNAISRRKGEGLKLIAEIKKASPSKGELRKDFYPAKIAHLYEKCGAQAISVLTDEKFFQGSLHDLQIVWETVSLPLLRKDFILDEYQVYEAKIYGASAILLIVSVLDKKKLSSLIRLISDQDMVALVEVHNEEELGVALECGAKIVGINNRDLKSFQVDLRVCEHLSRKIPSDVRVVAESGILNHQDVLRVRDLPIDAILVGEALMKASDISKKIKELMGLNGES